MPGPWISAAGMVTVPHRQGDELYLSSQGSAPWNPDEARDISKAVEETEACHLTAVSWYFPCNQVFLEKRGGGVHTFFRKERNPESNSFQPEETGSPLIGKLGCPSSFAPISRNSRICIK